MEEPFVMSLESKRRAIAKSLLITDPIVKPEKFDRYQNKYKTFSKNFIKKFPDSIVDFESWYVLMNMPCGCDKTQIWNLDVEPNVMVVWDGKRLDRMCRKCIQAPVSV